MPGIKGSVGRNGRNRKPDVLVVQKLLNAYIEDELNCSINPQLKFLAEDGICGRKTRAAIAHFQKKVVKYPRPDARVDPGRKTIQLLNQVNGKPLKFVPPQAVPQKLSDHKHHLRQEFADRQKLQWWSDFWDQVVMKDVTPQMKTFFNFMGRAEEVRKIATFYIFLRECGIDAREVRQILRLIAGSQDPKWGKEVVELLAAPTGKAGRALRGVAKAGKLAGLVAFFIEAADHWKKGDYHMLTVMAFKEILNEGIPWAGFVDSMQSFGGVAVPKSAQNTKYFEILKAINPSDLAAQGSDAILVTFGALVEMALWGEIDERRVYRLANRMKTGSTAIFYKQGDEMAKALAYMADMPDDEFDEMMSANNIAAWLWSEDGFWLTRYTPAAFGYRIYQKYKHKL